jgi:hypothetical protein
VKMNRRTSLQVILAAAALVVAGLTNRASADLVTVGQLGTINMTAGSQSGYINVPVFDAGGPSVLLAAWQLAIRIVPIAGATGTVTIDQASLAYPSNYIFPSGDRFPAGAPYTVPNTPTAGDLAIGGNANSFNGYTVTGSGQGLLDLKFNASAGATGSFDIRLVEVNQNSYWTEHRPTAVFPAPNYVDQPFRVNGTPLTLQTPGSLSLGTISVAAVPEPSSLLLSGAVVGFAGWRARRKRRKEAEAAATVAVATPAV